MESIKDIHFYYFRGIPQQGEFKAEGQEVQHMTKVMRLKEEDEIYLCDGLGTYYLARIETAKKDKATFEILHTVRSEFPRSLLTIAIAPTKNIDRFEWFLEKATEIGAGNIIALECERSERRRIKQDRCQRIIISAMKQSGRAWMPGFSGLVPFDILAGTPSDNSYIAHCGPGEKSSLIHALPEKQVDVRICIGPEGDFTENEIEAALSNGMKAVSLGASRLRTETAGVVACSMYQSSLL